jgi:hypothetical protein
MSPLAVQAGVISVEQVYNLMKMKAESLDIDPTKVLQRPMTIMSGPRLLAEEVISALFAGDVPAGMPAEDPMMHLQKLMEFTSGATQLTLEGQPVGPAFGALSTDAAQALNIWMQKVQMLIVQQQQLMAAMGGGGGGGQEQGGKEGEKSEATPANSTGENPQVNSGEYVDESANPGGLPQ